MGRSIWTIQHVINGIWKQIDRDQDIGEITMKKRILTSAAIAMALLASTAATPLSISAMATDGTAIFIQDNCVVTGNNDIPLRVRATPNGRVIGSLKIGTNIVAYGLVQDKNGNDWTKIKYKRGYGYVSTQFISCG